MTKYVLLGYALHAGVSALVLYCGGEVNITTLLTGVVTSILFAGVAYFIEKKIK